MTPSQIEAASAEDVRALLVERLIHTRDICGMMYGQHEAVTKAADQIEADGQRIAELERENDRLRDTPNHIWAEARDTEWDTGFNYAMKLFRAALGEMK